MSIAHKDCKSLPNQISEYLGCYHHVKRRKALVAFIEQLKAHVIPLERILDVGCGEGWYTSFLATKSDFVVGIDISIENLKNAKRNARNAAFVLCNANTLPFANSVFDLIIAAQFLEHMNKRVSTVRNLASLVTKRGLLLFEVPSRSNVIDYLFTKLLRRKPRWGLNIDPSHKHFFDQDQLKRLFNESNLKTICISGVVHFRYSFPLISRMVWDKKRRFWHLLDFFDIVVGMVKREWGSIQAYLLQPK